MHIIADYTQAIQINPQDALAYYNRGITYYKLGNLSQTRQDWEQAAALYKQQNNISRYRHVQEALAFLETEEAQQ